MNLFSRVVHNWELSLWPLWFQKHPLDWPENRGKKHYIYVHHIFQQAFLVITFIVKFRLTAKVCMLSHLFPQNIFAVALRCCCCCMLQSDSNFLVHSAKQHVAPLLLTFRDNLEQLENSLLISEQSYNGKS